MLTADNTTLAPKGHRREHELFYEGTPKGISLIHARAHTCVDGSGTHAHTHAKGGSGTQAHAKEKPK